MANITEINFIVGDLPEWYEESTHDFFVENWLEQAAIRFAQSLPQK